MPLRIDATSAEADAIVTFLPQKRGLSLLEIGCGDGRLTRKYASRVAGIIATDPDAAALAELRATLPPELLSRMDVRREAVDNIDLDAASIDVVLLAWSL